MQLNLAFLDLSDPPPSPAPTIPPPAAWDQLDEAARIAALELLARLIARMLADALTTRGAGHD
jgi:hypothetical protein